MNTPMNTPATQPDSPGMIAQDDSRRVIHVAGEEACDFLQSILTANVERWRKA